jgi:UPF0716 protein FxsA
MRRMVPLIGVAVIVLAAAEIAVFVAAVRLVGIAWALGAVLALSVLGGWLVPRQGVRAWRRFRAAAAEGRPPGRQVTDGLVGLIGALLLAAPGFLTGAAGALLFVPPVRWAARGQLERAVERRTSAAVAGDLFGPRRVRVRRTPPGTEPEPTTAEPAPPPASGPPPVIEGEIVDGPS